MTKIGHCELHPGGYRRDCLASGPTHRPSLARTANVLTSEPFIQQRTEQSFGATSGSGQSPDTTSTEWMGAGQAFEMLDGRLRLETRSPRTASGLWQCVHVGWVARNGSIGSVNHAGEDSGHRSPSAQHDPETPAVYATNDHTPAS